MKTANTKKHNYTRAINRYSATHSKRTKRAVLRTKRFDAGFFFLDFFFLCRDIILESNEFMTEYDLEVVTQLHANQPFSKDDVMDCIVSKRSYNRPIKWAKKTSYGVRATNKFMDIMIRHGVIYEFKTHGRNNKKLFVLTNRWEGIMKTMYENMLCITKIQPEDNRSFPYAMRKSKSHLKKALKQNFLKDGFDKEIENPSRFSNKEFSRLLMKLRNKL